MNNHSTFWAVVFLSVSLLSCNKQENQSPPLTPSTYSLEIEAMAPSLSRTHYEGQGVVNWDAKESIQLFYHEKSNWTEQEPLHLRAEGKALADNNQVVYRAVLPQFTPQTNSVKYYCISPADCFLSTLSLAWEDKFDVVLPREQQQRMVGEWLTFDARSDILYSDVLTHETQPQGLTFNFSRLNAIVEIDFSQAITDPDEVIQTLRFRNEEVPLSGHLTCAYKNGNFSMNPLQGETFKDVLLTFQGGERKAIFTTLPAKLERFSISMSTNKGKYYREITSAPALELVAGRKANLKILQFDKRYHGEKVLNLNDLMTDDVVVFAHSTPKETFVMSEKAIGDDGSGHRILPLKGGVIDANQELASIPLGAQLFSVEKTENGFKFKCFDLHQGLLQSSGNYLAHANPSSPVSNKLLYAKTYTEWKVVNGVLVRSEYDGIGELHRLAFNQSNQDKQYPNQAMFGDFQKGVGHAVTVYKVIAEPHR